MMKPILAVAATISLAIAGAGIADKSLDGGNCPGKCGLDCPADCGIDCPGDCDVHCPGDCGPEACKGCDHGCRHGEGKAKAADKAEAKANTGVARVSNTKLISLIGEGHARGHMCGHSGGHPEGHEGCKDSCGNGAGEVEADGDATDVAFLTNTKLVSLKATSDARSECPGQCTFKCPGDCGVDCPGDYGPESCKGPCDGCGHGTDKAKVGTSNSVAVTANTQ